uniref:Putative ovule protein n=1 Tax=Solanum chacoense TaxID=4108 RepID=A0A0V0GMP8_SOLCH
MKVHFKLLEATFFLQYETLYFSLYISMLNCTLPLAFWCRLEFVNDVDTFLDFISSFQFRVGIDLCNQLYRCQHNISAVLNH